MIERNKKGRIIWLTGLPCSGKTTLAREIEKFFKNKGQPIQVLDGDVIRTTFCSDLGFSKQDREENVRRVAFVAKLLSDNGVNVVVALISPYQKMRKMAKKICPNMAEVYVKCSLAECKRRDAKGMYKKALSGKMKNFTGVNDLYEEPRNPDLVVDTEGEKADEWARRVFCFLN